jgi:ADP-heptose:LPS heptosyltransferase
VVRRYLKLPEKDWVINELILKQSYQKILICPQSTDTNRNLPGEQLDTLILDFQKMYNQPEIIIASMDKSDFRGGCNKFILEKTAHSSEQFIDLIKKSALIVCSDSGPLHIALALKKDLLAFMKITVPDIVINSGSCLIINKF